MNKLLVTILNYIIYLCFIHSLLPHLSFAFPKTDVRRGARSFVKGSLNSMPRIVKTTNATTMTMHNIIIRSAIPNSVASSPIKLLINEENVDRPNFCEELALLEDANEEVDVNKD